MKTKPIESLRLEGKQIFAALILLTGISFGSATTHYVDVNSTNAQSPFLDWSMAATNIQDAVDVAVVGDEVVVMDGVYQTGGRFWPSGQAAQTNRVVVTNAVAVRSVNGPTVAVIQGYSALHSNSIRCVYLTNGASLSGFTVTNGLAGDGGGVWCASANEVISNCVLTGNSSYSTGAGAVKGMLRNCTITNNAAGAGTYGGGAYQSALVNCTITHNTANVGGGADSCRLTNCLVTGNSAINLGGGTASSTLDTCTLSSNSAPTGGGAYLGTFYNCTFSSNAATFGGQGGGAHGGTLSNCLITGNTANLGAGTSYGTVNHSTILRNLAAASGGGAYMSTVKNCFINSNTAFANGGGAYGGTVQNCVIQGNSAPNGGGYRFTDAGAGTAHNCSIVGNSASGSGGGVYSGSPVPVSMNNCIVFFNSAPSGANYSSVKLNYCCTTPISSGDVTSFTNAPALLDISGGDLHLQSHSPCINAGYNAYVTNSTDLDGNPRIVSGTVDIGAYEYQGSGSQISYAWLQQSGLPTDGSADFLDLDGDGLNNWQEWRCGTNPTNALSILRMLAPTGSLSGVTATWQSVTNRSYWLERTTIFGSLPPFRIVKTNITGRLGTTSYTDSNAIGSGPFFYRVGVQP